MTDLDYARSFFANDAYATKTSGIEIAEVGDGFSRVRLVTDARHYNALGHVMGGVYTSMADFAFAVAASYDRPPTVTVASSASFLAGSDGGELFAEARRIHEGGRTCVYEVRVTDDTGTLLVLVTVNGYKLRPKSAVSQEAAAAEPNPFRRYR